jgi:hypothetical protein
MVVLSWLNSARNWSKEMNCHHLLITRVQAKSFNVHLGRKYTHWFLVALHWFFWEVPFWRASMQMCYYVVFRWHKNRAICVGIWHLCKAARSLGHVSGIFVCLPTSFSSCSLYLNLYGQANCFIYFVLFRFC